MAQPQPLGPALTDGGPGDLRADTHPLGDRCVAPDLPISLAALDLYFALSSVHQNLPNHTAPFAKTVNEALNKAHVALWGMPRGA